MKKKRRGVVDHLARNIYYLGDGQKLKVCLKVFDIYEIIKDKNVMLTLLYWHAPFLCVFFVTPFCVHLYSVCYDFFICGLVGQDREGRARRCTRLQAVRDVCLLDRHDSLHCRLWGHLCEHHRRTNVLHPGECCGVLSSMFVLLNAESRLIVKTVYDRLFTRVQYSVLHHEWRAIHDETVGYL